MDGGQKRKGKGAQRPGCLTAKEEKGRVLGSRVEKQEEGLREKLGSEKVQTRVIR